MVWIFVEPEAIADQQLHLAGAQGRHLARVLRLRIGEAGVAVSAGLRHRFVVTAIEGDRIEARLDSAEPAGGEPPYPITLLQSLLPHADFDAALDAATQVGVTRIVPIRAERSVARGDDRRVGRWRAVIQAAAEQSHRGALPVIDGPRTLEQALAGIAGVQVYAFDPSAEEMAPHGSLRTAVAIAIGPEGGWSADELVTLTRAGAARVSLGPRVLRSRLAGAIAAAILQ